MLHLLTFLASIWCSSRSAFLWNYIMSLGAGVQWKGIIIAGASAGTVWGWLSGVHRQGLRLQEKLSGIIFAFNNWLVKREGGFNPLKVTAVIWVKPGYSQAPFLPPREFWALRVMGQVASPGLSTAKCTRTGIKLCVNLSFGYEALCWRAGLFLSLCQNNGDLPFWDMSLW